MRDIGPTTRRGRSGHALQRARPGWGLRIAGFSWDEIAEQLVYQSKSNACRAVDTYLGTMPQFDADRAPRGGRTTDQGVVLQRR